VSRPVRTVALLLIALGAVVSTGAVTGADEVVSGVYFDPADSTNGDAHAAIGADGNLSVELTDLNARATTDFESVFTISTDNRNSEVWIEHDAQAIRFYRTETGETLGDPSDPVVLGPDEVVHVGIEVTTDEQTTIEERIRVRARIPDPTPVGGGSGSRNGDEDGSGGLETTTGDPGPTTSPGDRTPRPRTTTTVEGTQTPTPTPTGTETPPVVSRSPRGTPTPTPTPTPAPTLDPGEGSATATPNATATPTNSTGPPETATSGPSSPAPTPTVAPSPPPTSTPVSGSIQPTVSTPGDGFEIGGLSPLQLGGLLSGLGLLGLSLAALRALGWIGGSVALSIAARTEAGLTVTPDQLDPDLYDVTDDGFRFRLGESDVWKAAAEEGAVFTNALTLTNNGDEAVTVAAVGDGGSLDGLSLQVEGAEGLDLTRHGLVLESGDSVSINIEVFRTFDIGSDLVVRFDATTE